MHPWVFSKSLKAPSRDATVRVIDTTNDASVNLAPQISISHNQRQVRTDRLEKSRR